MMESNKGTPEDTETTDQSFVKIFFPSELRYIILSTLFFGYAIIAIVFSISDWFVKKYDVKRKDVVAIALGMGPIYTVCMTIVCRSYRGMPFKVVGHHGRVAVDITTLCAAILLHLFLPYHGNKYALVILVSVTLQLHCWGQILHLAWDICFFDMLLQALMQVLIYLSTGFTFIMFLVLFTAVISYRFFSYLPPPTPESIKKDLSPC